MVQIVSSRDPFTSPRLAHRAITTLGRAEAMGLLPAEERLETLDLTSLRRVVRHVHRAGIGKAFHLGGGAGNSALERALDHLNLALEESPAPEFEWRRLADIFGIELLARLLGISAISVRRYKAAARTTPDEVAGRLHFLALIVGDLAGAYNDMGVRQWFDRKRAQLGGRAPAEFLQGAWDAGAPGVLRVRDLARSLTASPAT